MALHPLLLIGDLDKIIDQLEGRYVDLPDLITSVHNVIGHLLYQFYITKRLPTNVLKSYFINNDTKTIKTSSIFLPNLTKAQITKEIDNLRIKLREQQNGKIVHQVIPPTWLLPILFRILQNVFADKKGEL